MPPKENIFDLSKMVAASNDVEVQITGENTQLLNGYELVEKENWGKIPYQTHIRYLRTDGTMRNGGYVMCINHTNDLSGNDTIKIDLTSSLTNGKPWSIYKGNISKIWKKTGLQQQMQSNADISGLKEDIEFLKKENENLKKELQNVINDQKRIVQLIKKISTR